MRKIALAAALLAAVPATAQIAAQPGLVNVNIQNVDILRNFLSDAQVAALNNLSVPITVQVPVGIAANVCGVNANILAQQRKGEDPVTCTANNGSRALANAVADQRLGQTR